MVRVSPRGVDKLRTPLAFGIAFVVGATAIFTIVAGLGLLTGAASLPAPWRLGLAGMGLLILAVIDVLAIGKSTYCPLGWRRQTPRFLMRRHPAVVVAAVWGFDTGLAITTFRVAAVTWGALLLTGLGLAPWWSGLGYGLGFVLPFSALLWLHPVGRSAGDTASDPGLESMLAKRAVVQLLSATLLIAGGGLVMGRLMG